jgi:hypothetical protein
MERLLRWRGDRLILSLLFFLSFLLPIFCIASRGHVTSIARSSFDDRIISRVGIFLWRSQVHVFTLVLRDRTTPPSY